MERPRLDVYAAEWGSLVDIPNDPDFAPRYTLIHWGGLTAHIPPEGEQARLRSWQRTHLARMSDIAYQIAVGDSGLAYEGRSWRSGGHVKCSRDKTPEGDSYCDASVGIVWIGGRNAGKPSDAALKTMGRLCRDLGNPVKSHRTVKEENGSWTECPGNDWIRWILEEGWAEDMTSEETSNPAFQPAWDKARAQGVFSQWTKPSDVVTAEKFAVFLDRAGLLEQPNG